MTNTELNNTSLIIVYETLKFLLKELQFVMSLKIGKTTKIEKLGFQQHYLHETIATMGLLTAVVSTIAE